MPRFVKGKVYPSTNTFIICAADYDSKQYIIQALKNEPTKGNVEAQAQDQGAASSEFLHA